MGKACPACGAISQYDEEQNHCFRCGMTNSRPSQLYDIINESIAEKNKKGDYKMYKMSKIKKKNLKCCGNCWRYGNNPPDISKITCGRTGGKFYGKETYPWETCDDWMFDDLDHFDREIEESKFETKKEEDNA